MTKTLTEQWREGKLPPGKYYIKTKWWGCDGKWHYEKEEDIDYLDGDWRFYQDDSVAEVLAPVPSYNKVKEMSQKIERLEFDNEALETSRNELVQKMHILEKKLEIATKALKKLTRNCNKWEITREALKEMEGVK